MKTGSTARVWLWAGLVLAVGAVGAALCRPALSAPVPTATASPARGPWTNATLAPAHRAAAMVGAMTLDEKLALLTSDMPILLRDRPAGAILSAGFMAGVPRLGLPPLTETDASLGVANLANMRHDDVATAMPSSLATAATWDPALAYAGGAMIGREARAKGFNVMLAGGVDLVREPRNGRAFEYLGEDPLLAGTLAGQSVRGIQSNVILSTVKHYALNDQETARETIDVTIPEASARESDLLAFELAIEGGHPGAVMSGYNKVNGDWCSENAWLLTDVLKRDWHYPGFVMSDWGNVHSAAKAALAGLDQQSGATLDKQRFFAGPLRAAVAAGQVPMSRIDDMAQRIVGAMIAGGLIDHPAAAAAIDPVADADVAQRTAEAGLVLLKNEAATLPLAAGIRSIVLVGAHADIGVLSGGGSSQVRPVGGPALELHFKPGEGLPFGSILYDPSSPLRALQARYPQATVTFVDGADAGAAAAAAAHAEVAIVFAEQWRSEAADVPTLSLPRDQDRLIAAVAAANPHTIVVLETGGAVLMPWLAKAGAVLEAWYPGQRGAEALAAILSGDLDPAGRLPISFPASETQLPAPSPRGTPMPAGGAARVDYTAEGPDVGYKWYLRQGTTPLFPFGYGLSYTQFSYDGLHLSGGDTLTVRLRVRNEGARAGIATPQVYATLDMHGGRVTRLIGWQRIALQPGQAKMAVITADPRLLAAYDPAGHGWRIAAGRVTVTAGADVAHTALTGQAMLAARSIRP